MKRIALLLLFTIFTVGVRARAAAAPGLKENGTRHIDFTRTLTSFDGQTIMTSEKSDAVPATLSYMVIGALTATLPEDQAETGIEALNGIMERNRLAERIFNNNDAVLTDIERALIEKRLGETRFHSTAIYEAVIMLDPAQK